MVNDVRREYLVPQHLQKNCFCVCVCVCVFDILRMSAQKFNNVYLVRPNLKFHLFPSKSYLLPTMQIPAWLHT